MSSQGATTRTATPTSQGGSRTLEVRPQPVLRLSAPSGVLRLRAEPTERRRIQWAEDVVDNEGMGKKSSKGNERLSRSTVASTDIAYSLLYLPQAPRR